MGRLLAGTNRINWVPVDSGVLQVVANLAHKRLLYPRFKAMRYAATSISRHNDIEICWPPS